VRARTTAEFFDKLGIMFQREQSKGLDATYHFVMAGGEQLERTVRIHDRKIEVSEGLNGKEDFAVKADSRTWLAVTTKEKGPLAAMLSGKLRFKGPLNLFKAFVRCFPV